MSDKVTIDQCCQSLGFKSKKLRWNEGHTKHHHPRAKFILKVVMLASHEQTPKDYCCSQKAASKETGDNIKDGSIESRKKHVTITITSRPSIAKFKVNPLRANPSKII